MFTNSARYEKTDECTNVIGLQIELRRNGCSAHEAADKILFIPDALIYMLTGKAICEYPIASTSSIDVSIPENLALEMDYMDPYQRNCHQKRLSHYRDLADLGSYI